MNCIQAGQAGEIFKSAKPVSVGAAVRQMIYASMIVVKQGEIAAFQADTPIITIKPIHDRKIRSGVAGIEIDEIRRLAQSIYAYFKKDLLSHAQ